MTKRLLTAGMLCAVALGACSVPTDAPRWQTRWVVPAKAITVWVEELMPPQITVDPNHTEFTIDVGSAGFSQSLDDLCDVCGPLNGLPVLKPPFAGILSGPVFLPPLVLSVNVVQADIDIEIENGFGFDPIRPAFGFTGSMALTVYDGTPFGRVLDKIEIKGADQSFAPGSKITRTFSVDPGTIEGAVWVEAYVISPGGDLVVLDTSDRLSVSVTVRPMRIADAKVLVAGNAFAFTTVELDLEDIGDDVIERINDGALRLRVENQFELGADGVIEVRAPGLSPILKTLHLDQARSSDERIAFTREEMHSILGTAGVVLTGAGVVSSTVGPVVITPATRITAAADIEFEIELGEQ